MVPGPEADALNLERILTVIDRIRSSLSPVSYDLFRSNFELIDATALRLAAIGESGRKLSVELKQRHPTIPWTSVYKLRNIVAHHYDSIDPEIIWNVARGRLDDIEAVCRTELERLGG
jgi:uncharacterized protein with HEPN domain